MRAKSLVLIALLLFAAAPALAGHHEVDNEPTSTQSGRGSDESQPLTATFEPAPEAGMYSTVYYFAMTRSLANSTVHKAVQLPLFLVTVPVDIVLLPAAAIAGFF